MKNILLAMLLSVAAGAQANSAHPYSGIYVLGTSLSDEGNAFIQCGMQSVPPYDNLGPQIYAPGDAPYAIGGHHFSNGPTWVVPLASELGVINSVLPVRRNPVGTNYAQAGTTALPATLPCRITFEDQINDVLARGGIPGDALVTVEIGSNDVINALEAFAGALLSGYDVPTAKAYAIVNFLLPAADLTVLGINQLIGGGATTVLWANVTDLGLTPTIAITDAQLQGLGLPAGLFAATATELAEMFNMQVQTQVQSDIDSGTIVKFDLFQIVQDLVYNDSQGFNVTDACVTPNQPPFSCQKADSYLFWDGVHPTKAGHKYFAGEAMKALGL
jgi:phospholipase/lecithinase/hemolysin